jgi:NAD(P)-dependent dehydrogenase (short-subunit alcohol dehydrogenase family)
MTEVIVVIGPGQIGQAIARRVGVGKHVQLADLREDNAVAAAEVLSNAGYDVSVATVDVSSREAVHALVERVTGLGEVTGLIHAAGVSPSQAPPATILKVDLYGTWLFQRTQSLLDRSHDSKADADTPVICFELKAQPGGGGPVAALRASSQPAPRHRVGGRQQGYVGAQAAGRAGDPTPEAVVGWRQVGRRRRGGREAGGRIRGGPGWPEHACRHPMRDVGGDDLQEGFDDGQFVALFAGRRVSVGVGGASWVAARSASALPASMWAA